MKEKLKYKLENVNRGRHGILIFSCLLFVLFEKITETWWNWKTWYFPQKHLISKSWWNCYKTWWFSNFPLAYHYGRFGSICPFICKFDFWIACPGTARTWPILSDLVKFIYSEKSSKFCEISTVDLTGNT